MAHRVGGGASVVQITEGPITRQILAFFFPILFGTLFQQLYNTADTVIVGQFVGTEALAAVGGATSALLSIVINLFGGLASGATVVLAQSYGAREFEKVRATVRTSMVLVLTAGTALTVLGVALAPWALRMMGTPQDVFPLARTYLRVYLLGTIPSFFYNIGAGLLRAVGDTRRPLYFLILSCAVNIGLDCLFVAGLRLSVLGAALATILSQVFSAALVFRCLVHTDAPYRFDWRGGLRGDRRILADILRVGVPMGLQSNMYSISNILIQASINGFGTATVAAWTIHGKIDSFYWMISGALGISVTTFAGQNFGAKKYDRIHKSVRVCLVIGYVSAALMSALYYGAAPFLFRLFTRDAAVVEIGIDIVRQLALWYASYVCIEMFAGAARGCGCSVAPMLMTCGGVCVLRVLWVLIVPRLRPGLAAVLASYPVSWVFTGVIFIIYYFQGGWLKKRIAIQNRESAS